MLTAPSSPQSAFQNTFDLDNEKPKGKKERAGAVAKGQNSTGNLPKLGEGERFVKDEMNLVEYPFAMLKSRTQKENPSVISIEWERQHPRTGKLIQASWRVSGDPVLGLPGPTEERLYLVMMELSREQGWPQRVMFSRGDVLDRLGMTRGKQNYQVLADSFARFNNLGFDARNCYWDKASDSLRVVYLFHMINDVVIISEPAGRRSGQVPMALSSFQWHSTFYQSLCAGYFNTLPLGFALSLELPLSFRLFRYLDRHRGGSEQSAVRHKYEIGLRNLCEVHLGMTHARYPSKYKERILPALNELKTRGFLLDFEYQPMKTSAGEDKIVFYYSNAIMRAPDGVGVSNGVENETAPESGAQDNAHELLRKAEARPLAVLQRGLGADTPSAPELDAKALLSASLNGKSAFADLLPAFDAPSALDHDPRGHALDEIFEGLSDEEQFEINAQVRQSLPIMLLHNMDTDGARNAMTRGRRQKVAQRYPLST